MNIVGPCVQMASTGADSALGLGVSHVNTDVYYVPVDMDTMQRIEDYYTYGDSLITRANSIRSDLAFASGFYLEFAERNKIMPSDSYDYTSTIEVMLEKARKYRDMFGFVAFVQRNESLADESKRQRVKLESGHEATPQELAEQHIEHCKRLIIEKIGSMEGKRRPEERSPTMAKKKRSEPTAVDPSDEAKPGRVQASIEPIDNGTSLLASEARLVLNEAVRKTRELGSKMATETTRRKSIIDMLLALENVSIVSPGEGTFYVEIDCVAHSRRLVWVPGWRRQAQQSAHTSGGRLRHVDYDRNVSVFAWPGRIPTDTGHIRSDFLEIIRLREMLREAEDNQMDADYATAHPVPFIQHGRGPVRADLADLPEEDIYGIDLMRTDNLFDKSSMTPSDMQTYRRDVRAAIELESSVEKFNRNALLDRASTLKHGPARRSQAAGAHGFSDVPSRRHVLERAGLMELPGGMQLGGTVNSSTIVNTIELRNTYDMRLSVALGVPLTFLQGSSINSSSLGSTGPSSATTMSSIMRTTITSDREEMSRFFDYLYNTLFRDVDNEALMAELSGARQVKAHIERTQQAYARIIRTRFDLVTDMPRLSSDLDALLNEAARVCTIETEVRRIASLQYRLRLKFVKTPFVESSEIVRMHDLGAVSGIEMANILRQNAGLEKIEEAEYERNTQRLVDIEVERTQAVAKAQQQAVPAQPQ